MALLGLIAARPAALLIDHFVSGWLVFAAGIAFCHLLPMFRNVSASYLIGPAAWIAKYSYGIYLVHAPLMLLVFVRMPRFSAAVQVGVFFSLVLICSVALFHAVEQPMIRFGVHLTGAGNA